MNTKRQEILDKCVAKIMQDYSTELEIIIIKAQNAGHVTALMRGQRKTRRRTTEVRRVNKAVDALYQKNLKRLQKLKLSDDRIKELTQDYHVRQLRHSARHHW